VDIKLLIARSSVVHIRICVAGLFIFREWAYKGCLIVIVGHGLCSSGLFFLANRAYERTGRRRILVSKGLLSIAPRLRLWWFLLVAANIAAPPSLNLLGEVRLMISLVGWDYRVI
jgi:NADH-ubiquinone oxidoreductase chain 4